MEGPHLAREGTELGRRLRELREGRGLTQEQLALAIGTSQPYIARIESGITEPRLDTLQRLAAALGYAQIGIVFRERAH